MSKHSKNWAAKGLKFLKEWGDNLIIGIKWCMNWAAKRGKMMLEWRVSYSEGEKFCKIWAAIELNWCKSVGVIFLEGVKWCMNWATKGAKKVQEWWCNLFRRLILTNFIRIDKPSRAGQALLVWRLSRTSWKHRDCGFKNVSVRELCYVWLEFPRV